MSEVPVEVERPSLWAEMRMSEDWWAIWVGGLILLVSLLMVSVRPGENGAKPEVVSPAKGKLALPGAWQNDPRDSFFKESKDATGAVVHRPLMPGILTAGGVLLVLFAGAVRAMGHSPVRFAIAFVPVFLLAVCSYVQAGQATIESLNLEYALWALLLGLVICNTVGTPAWLRPAVQTEFYIKTGLVLLGAEVLMSKLLALGAPGVLTSWTVTPIVLITTFVFGQKILKIESPSLNMVISADMSVCGVSAAIATGAACRAKKEELSLAIGLSLVFTVGMMVVMPTLIRMIGLDDIVGGAWLGGTIDSTGAVAAAGAVLGEDALTVAATVKMIQNVLIGVVAFCVAVYWVTRVEPQREGTGSKIGLMEIWYRFPKFVIGFVAASIVFSLMDGNSAEGAAVAKAVTGDVTKVLRGWLFCLAFVSIGLETNFKEFLPYLKGGKALTLYVCGQTLNVVLSLLMSWLMFGVIYRDQIEEALRATSK